MSFSFRPHTCTRGARQNEPMASIPQLTLNDGNTIPQLGFGVYKIPADETADAVVAALDAGYRHIDTAAFYENERGVGEGVRRSGLARSEVFVTSKVWWTENGYDSSLRSFDRSLELLGFDSVDLFLIHWPAPKSDRYVETWHALERVRVEGRARSIGVANFHPHHLERLAGESATQHLIELGHRRIGYVAGPEHYLPTRQKAAGRESAMRAAGLEVDGLVEHGDFSVEGGRAALRALLAHSNPPSGIICSSDLMAIGVLGEASAQGLRVPEDLSVVGFDGIDATRWTNPPLTTVEQPIEEIAETAVNALRSLIEDPGKPLPDSLFRPQLALRGSTAAPATRP
jgi:DNA-binding LacI/PurR family transcriptional regulator